jgi:hypothetical protein
VKSVVICRPETFVLVVGCGLGLLAASGLACNAQVAVPQSGSGGESFQLARARRRGWQLHWRGRSGGGGQTGSGSGGQSPPGTGGRAGSRAGGQGGRRRRGATIATRTAGVLEGAAMVRRCGYYYLFMSWDRCCLGAQSTYNIRVGRSISMTGGFVDKAGLALTEGGGTLLVGAGNGWVGPGGESVLFSGNRAYLLYHAYAATVATSRCMSPTCTGTPAAGR